MIKLAPICLFTYNRLEETKKTLAALQQNNLAKESELFVFSDGWKNKVGKGKVIAVRKLLKDIRGFKKVTVFESETNKGLANSIINGVTQIIEQYEKVIVLEDDLVTSSNFLDFMNQALNFYEDNDKIFSISGFSMDLKSLKNYDKDFYLGYRASSWGWATWKYRWDKIDWEVEDYNNFKNSYKQKQLFKRGGNDLPRMLNNQIKGRIDSWAIRWCYQQFKNKQFTVFPKKSKVKSIGFGTDATHTQKTKRFHTILDNSLQKKFSFEEEVYLIDKLVKEHKSKFSIIMRILDRF